MPKGWQPQGPVKRNTTTNPRAGKLYYERGPYHVYRGETVRVPRRTNAPTPTAAPSAPAGPAPLPVDPVYQNQLGGLARSRDDALTGLAGEQTRALSDYGYNASFDASGGVSSLAFDPNNPFSQAALLRKHYQQSKSATTNSMASRGQLYAGALQTALDRDDVNFQQGDDRLQKALTGSLSDISDRRRRALADYEFGAGSALSESVGRAQENPLYEPTPPSKPAGEKPQVVEGKDSKGNPGKWHIYKDRKVFVRKR